MKLRILVLVITITMTFAIPAWANRSPVSSGPQTPKEEYKQGGKQVGRGGKRLARNVKKGRVVEGGKELGKGIGRGAKRVARGTKKAVDPNASKKQP